MRAWLLSKPLMSTARSASLIRVGKCVSTRISAADLARLGPTALKLGLSHEFQVRADGYPALRRAYALPQAGIIRPP